MVNHSGAVLDLTFAALADPTRRAILERLARGGATVSELAEPFAMSLPAVSKHLRVLEGARLLARRRHGRHHRITLAPSPLRTVSAWLEDHRRFWEGRLDSLARYLESASSEEDSSWQSPAPTRRSRSSARTRRLPRRSSARGRTRRR